jgi:hypothetical protein
MYGLMVWIMVGKNESQMGAALQMLFLVRSSFVLKVKGLTDITPLGQCGEVRELILSVNEIRSIEALSGCKQLKKL